MVIAIQNYGQANDLQSLYSLYGLSLGEYGRHAASRFCTFFPELFFELNRAI